MVGRGINIALSILVALLLAAGTIGHALVANMIVAAPAAGDAIAPGAEMPCHSATPLASEPERDPPRPPGAVPLCCAGHVSSLPAFTSSSPVVHPAFLAVVFAAEPPAEPVRRTVPPDPRPPRS